MNIKILSRNANLYSTQRLIEACKKRKHDVEVIDPLKCDLIIEKRKPTIVYKGRVLEHVDAVIPRVGASITFYGTAVVRQFEMMGAFTTTESQALVRKQITVFAINASNEFNMLFSDFFSRLPSFSNKGKLRTKTIFLGEQRPIFSEFFEF